jgi:lipopolysaccharide biosynthesis glycosyltransferase
MLPELLPDIDRVVLLPLDALVEGDVAALADIDLAGQALAAPNVAGNTGASGFGVIHNAGNRLSTRTTVATELRRRAHARHTFDFTAFDIDVLVMDLERLRKEEMAPEAVQLLEEFGLGAREVLHFHVGPERATVPRAWHVVPTRNHEDEPALLHWVDEAKPWTADYAPEQERWLERRRLMRQRLAAK